MVTCFEVYGVQMTSNRAKGPVSSQPQDNTAQDTGTHMGYDDA